MKYVNKIVLSCALFAALGTSAALSAEDPQYEAPPCKDVIVDTEGEQFCTTDDGIKFTKRGDAWFRMEKLHEKPLGGKNSVPNVVGRAVCGVFGC